MLWKYKFLFEQKMKNNVIQLYLSNIYKFELPKQL